MNPIRVTNSRTTHINSRKSETTVDQLRPLVVELVYSLELRNEFNQEIYNKLSSLDINMSVLQKMLNDLYSFIEFDDVPDQVNFPYEEWLTQLILIDDNYKI